MLVEKPHWCPHREQFRPLICCAACPRYPCAGVDKTDIGILVDSELTDKSVDLIARRKKMFVFKLIDGTMEPAYEGFDPDHPVFAKLENVGEVLCINKVLVKQIRLVVKPVEERKKIIKERKAVEESEESKAKERRIADPATKKKSKK